MQRRRSPESQLALWNAVSVGAVRQLERILDELQVEKAEQREPLPQTIFSGVECDFEPEATLAAFTTVYATLPDSPRQQLISIQPHHGRSSLKLRICGSISQLAMPLGRELRCRAWSWKYNSNLTRERRKIMKLVM